MVHVLDLDILNGFSLLRQRARHVPAVDHWGLYVQVAMDQQDRRLDLSGIGGGRDRGQGAGIITENPFAIEVLAPVISQFIVETLHIGHGGGGDCTFEQVGCLYHPHQRRCR